jgi:hypothetical protein
MPLTAHYLVANVPRYLKGGGAIPPLYQYIASFFDFEYRILSYRMF